MSEYKRLTYKNNCGEWCIDKTKGSAIVPVQDGDNRYYIGEPIDCLAKLEDEIENGTLVRLPCKVGDTIFYVDDDGIFTYIVDRIGCDSEGWYFTVDDEDHFEHYFDDQSIIGVTVFFERDKAEAKLRELKGEK